MAHMESEDSLGLEQVDKDERAAKLKGLRKGKLAHLTRRKNVLVELMQDVSCVQEVRDNFAKYAQLLEEFKDTHNAYQEMLTEDEAEQDEEWFDPKNQEINDFVAFVSEWLHGASKGKQEDDANLDLGPKDSASQVSKSPSSVASARRCAEAERVALEIEMAALAQRHDLQEKEAELDRALRAVKQKREALELKIRLDASSSKLAVLTALEDPAPRGEGKDAMNDYFSETSFKDVTEDGGFLSLDKAYKAVCMAQTPGVRPKEGVHFQPVHLGANIAAGQKVTSSPAKWTMEGPATCKNKDSVKANPDLQASLSQESLIKVLKGQNEISALLVQQQQLYSLPHKEIPMFSGDVLSYQTFIRAFEHVVELKTRNSADRLYFLEQYTSGLPNELVKSCLHMSPEGGYQKAKCLLQENYGDEFKICAAYIKKALEWPAVKNEDPKALQTFTLFLRSCCNAMEELRYSQEMNLSSNMKLLIMKLPYKFRERWRTFVCEFQEKQSRRPQFKELVSFLEKQVKILCDPVYGDIQDKLTKPKERPVRARPKSNGSSFATMVSTAASQPSQEKELVLQSVCVVCNKSHRLEDCRLFKTKRHRDKITLLKEKGMCFSCLHQGHISKFCKQKQTCSVCQRQHPSVLHTSQNEKPKQDFKVTTSRDANVRSNTQSMVVHPKACGHIGAGTETSNVLSVVPVKVKASKGCKVMEVYAFIDPGSTDTFCTERLVSQLGLKGRKAQILLKTMGHEKLLSTSIVSGLEVSGMCEEMFLPLPDSYTQKEMPVTKDNIPRKQDLDRWSYLQSVHIPEIDSNIELLIGTNASKVIEPWEIINSQGQGPYAVRTLVGWVINGPLRDDNSNEGYPSAHVNRITVESLEKMLICQYNMDFNEKASEEKRELSREDKRFLEIMDTSVELINGHYNTDLPFRNKVEMPNNRQIAVQRLQSLKRKFMKSDSFHKEYTDFVNDILTEGYAEVVPREETEKNKGKTWYIPHHGVYHPRKNTLRVVFDCGAEFQGVSLNSQLLQGPDLTNSLIGVLLRFRHEPIALMADIKSMFHQVRVSQADIDFLRFLWWPNGDYEKEPKDHRMLVHIFGAVSSPSCASYALRKTAQDNSGFSSQVTDTVLKHFYVDDCLTSAPTEQDAVQLISDLVLLCSKGGFHLTKWVSNSRAVLAGIKEEARGKEIRSLDLSKDQLPTGRALGLQWRVEDDTFRFDIKVTENPLTRRGILSMVSSVYDPLGMLAPVTLPAKQLLQQLCKSGYGWDEELPPELTMQWTKWVQDIPKLSQFSVSRCMKPKNFGKPISYQLHHFSDASESGYGAVSYLCMTSNTKQRHVVFMIGKARVAPLKQMTVPRLELTAAVISVKVDKMLKAELVVPLQKSMFWTDSQAVLKYIANETTRFKTFVANRTSTIRDNTSVDQWNYIDSKHNPADEASRGQGVTKFNENVRWLRGPAFLWEPEYLWPNQSVNQSLSQDDPEVKKCTAVYNVSVVESSTPTHKLLHFFSDWTKLLKAVAWYHRFGDYLLILAAKQRHTTGQIGTRATLRKLSSQLQAVKGHGLSIQDLGRAERSIISFSQRQAFPAEIDRLETDSGMVHKRSTIYRLDPFLKDGVLRVSGRLSKSLLSEDVKYPIILPQKCHISSLLLRHIHEKYGHCGRNYIISQLRTKYWVIKANTAARSIINKCVLCKRLKGKTGEQKMADLPQERTLPDVPPFTSVGMDYFGPIETKRGRSLVKRYGVLFTCLACRAVHIEMACSLDTDSCIHAIRRFMCRRGQVKQIRSDNGTNLVGAHNELKRALSNLNDTKIQSAMLERGITWTFNPPGASHHGGVWERLIRSVRWVLNCLLRQQTVDDEGLTTLFCEVEAILNNRPITTASSDQFDLEPLTPNHLLLLNSQPILPPGEFFSAGSYTRRRWKQVQYLADVFWRRWTQEYLTTMQHRQKWCRVKRNFKVGDIVVIVDPSAPRASWPLARILETRPDSKGLVRSVKLKTKTGILERPVTKICFLLEEEYA